jgi:hypothetical protein
LDTDVVFVLAVVKLRDRTNEDVQSGRKSLVSVTVLAVEVSIGAEVGSIGWNL